MYGGLCGMQKTVTTLSHYTFCSLHEEHCIQTAAALYRDYSSPLRSYSHAQSLVTMVFKLTAQMFATGVAIEFDVHEQASTGMHLTRGISLVTF